MNLWVKKTGLILGLALFIFACDEPGEIGLDLNPEQENFVISSVEVPVDVSVGWAAPYLLYDAEDGGLGAINIGKQFDARFGTIISEGYAQIVPADTVIKLPDDAVYYKTSLKLFVTNIYPDLDDYQREQVVRIHELTEAMDSTNYSSTTYAYNPEPLAEVKFHLDSLVSGMTVTSEFPDELGMEIFNALKADTILTDKEVAEMTHGVAFIPDENNNMLFSLFPFDETTTGIEVEYISGDDTTALRYLFEGIHSYSVQTDFTGTELASLQQGGETITGVEFGYLSSLAGIYGELDFSPILDLQDSLGKVVINNAELYLENALEDTLYRTPSSIYALEKKENFKIENMPFFTISESRYVNLDKIENTFRFSLSAERNGDGDKTGNYFVNLTFPSEFTPSDRSPVFEDYIKSLISASMDDGRLVITPSSFGRSFNNLVFKKDAVKLKIHFSYLKNRVQ